MHVVLVEPEIPQNTGNVARTCAAVGADLHLVHPIGFSIDERSVRRAGLDYWSAVRVHEYGSLAEFLSVRGAAGLFLFSRHASTPFHAVHYSRDSMLVFGRESTGLPDALLGAGYPVVRIPMVPGTRSLNLSNAVAVAVYEALRQQGYPDLEQSAATGNARPASQ